MDDSRAAAASQTRLRTWFSTREKSKKITKFSLKTNKKKAKSSAVEQQHKIWGGYVGRLLEIIGLFCKRAILKRLYSAKETYNFEEPTNRRHPIPISAPGFRKGESQNKNQKC